MNVELELIARVDERGFVGGLDFSTVKGAFRFHLDTQFDHRLLLNKDDPYASLLTPRVRAQGGFPVENYLPGLNPCIEDPTTENLAAWIGAWALEEFEKYKILGLSVVVEETRVNKSRWWYEL